MSKNETIYTCSKCDAQSPKWQGRCQICGAWGTLMQENKKATNQQNKSVTGDKTISLNEIESSNEDRLKTNIEELDRVLGGGLAVGSVVILGGDPGIGKSTLALQIAGQIKNCLYISGEESAGQVKMRAQRLNLNLADFQFLNQTNIEIITATIKDARPPLVIIDSIQTMTSDEASGAFGGAGQIIAATGQLVAVAKENCIPIIIIGHVTKEGIVAGPKTLEHLVDTVLYLENDNNHHYKILRSVKNRFGATNEIGIFEMTGDGFQEISDPTKIFFSGEESKPGPGTMATIIIEGSRPFLVEVQALTAKIAFGYPQRKSHGFDLSRLQMLIAVIAKTTKINLAGLDIYLNVAGGFRIKETASDLAVCLAIISAGLDIPLAKKMLAIGEVSLTGSVRPIANLQRRIAEAQKLGFDKILAPATDKSSSGVITISDLSEVIKIINAG